MTAVESIRESDPATESFEEEVAKPGDLVGRYRVVRRIGNGAMGTVFEASDPNLGRSVAIKLIHGHWAATAAGRRRVTREARALASLSHPNVLPIYDVGPHGEATFIAMEFVDGPTLRTWQRDLSPHEVIGFYVDAGRGLAAAHRAGLIHRDFKPDNVLVGPDRRPRVADFGLATAPTDLSNPSAEASASLRFATTDRATRSGKLVGTPAYMAPELLRGARASASSDQFAFCVALFEALYGARPFRGRTTADLLASTSQGPPAVPPHRIANDVWFAAIVKGLATHPRARHPAMDELVAELGRRRPRRWQGPVAGGAAVLAVAVVAGGWRAYASKPADDCTAQGLAVQRAYAAQRDEVVDRLEQLGTPSARDLLPRARDRLDVYAVAWAAASTKVCEAASQAPSKMDTRAASRCLASGRREFEAALRILTTEDIDTTPAIRALERLGSPERCLVPSTWQSPRWELETVDDRETQQILADVSGLAAVGALSKASALLDGRWPDIDALASAHGRARAWQLRGTLRVGLGELRSGRKALETAYEMAQEHGFDRIATQTAITLMHVHITEADDVEMSESWGRHARALSSRSNDRRLEAAYLSKHAELLERRNQLAEARREALAARDVLTADAEVPSLRVAAVDRLLGSLAVRRRDFDAARWRFESSLSNYIHVAGFSCPNIPSVMTGLVNVELSDRNLDEARALLEQARALRVRSHGPGHWRLGVFATLEASIHDAAGDHDAAIEALDEALSLYARQPQRHERLIRTALRKKANAYARLGEHDTSLQLYSRVLAFAEASDGFDSVEVATANHNIAEAESALGRFDVAMHHYEIAVNIFESALGSDASQLAFPLTGWGEALLSLDRVDAARPVLERALTLTAPDPSNRREWAQTAFALAMTLWRDPTASPDDRIRAVELAEEANVAFESFPDYAREQQEVERWLESL